MMTKNYIELVNINHNPNWSYIPDHSYWIIIIGGFGSGKTNALLNLIKHRRPDSSESKYYLLINGREKVAIKKLRNMKTFMVYSQTMSMKI